MIHIHGYAETNEREKGPLEMREVTFSASPDILRQIAKFFSEMADLMEQGGFSKTSHKHIGSVIPNWDKRFPKREIIIMPPMPTRTEDALHWPKEQD